MSPPALHAFGVPVRHRWESGPLAGRERGFHLCVAAMSAEAVRARLPALVAARYRENSGESVTCTLLEEPRRIRPLAGFQGQVDYCLMPEPGDLLDGGERELLRHMADALLQDGFVPGDPPPWPRMRALLARLGVGPHPKLSP